MRPSSGKCTAHVRRSRVAPPRSCACRKPHRLGMRAERMQAEVLGRLGLGAAVEAAGRRCAWNDVRTGVR